MATIVGIKTNNMNIGHMQQNQLTRSLERILEEAHLSGELKLSGRKLKDFPKCAGKYNLNDTVIADLSRNRFCELPEDVTNFSFLETLLVYHNTLRSIPESIRGLYSLSYLDLRSNQLTQLPREICVLPIQVLLVSNNRLITLPDELGRMENLTELDAACNQITHLPSRMSDLKNLKSLSLRNNQLVYLPREIKYLNLVFLDVSCNRIATLPVELRLMTTLVNLELSNNPLTSPPASLCVRGLVHVFKYLETAAAKEKSGGSYDGHTTLRRTVTPKQQQSVQLVDSNADKMKKLPSEWTDKSDKNWLNDLSGHESGGNQFVQSNSSTPSGSPIARGYDHDSRSITPTNTNQRLSERQNNSNDSSPECDYNIDGHKVDDKFKLLGNVQTYREYKEALRQQRNQDSSAIYRPKDQSTPTNGNTPTHPYANCNKSQTLSPTLLNSNSNQNSPTFVQNKTQSSPDILSPNQNGHSPTFNSNNSDNMAKTEDIIMPKKPVQKVTPSRNTNIAYNNIKSTSSSTSTSSSSTVNGNNEKSNEYDGYVKPKSPTNAGGIFYSNNMIGSTQSMNKITPNKSIPKPNRSVSWNRDIPADKLSFTMRREFDKQKEETELIDQLRNIIESRLKMSLPTDIASALCDGVVLCHLANHVRPRSVGSIHVPSPAVPKLTMAKCRRNVDNFLNACRSIGVDDEFICSCGDIVPLDDQPNANLPNMLAVYRTVAALHAMLMHQQQIQKTATNTKTAMETNSNNEDNGHLLDEPDTANNNDHKYSLDEYKNSNMDYFDNDTMIDYYHQEFNGNYNQATNVSYLDARNPPKTLDLTKPISKKRKLSRKVFNSNKYETFNLNGIIEENDESEQIIELKQNGNHSIKLNLGMMDRQKSIILNGGNNGDEICAKNNIKITEHKTGIVKNDEFLKRIEFFELNNQTNNDSKQLNETNNNNDTQLSTILCLSTFLLTFLVLIFFEIPS